MKAQCRVMLLGACALFGAVAALAQQTDPNGNVEGPISPGVQRKKNVPPPSTPAPASGESSSDQTKIDLRPPMGDAVSHPDSGHVADRTGETHWDPMRAMKDVEVGDFYYRNAKYTAAINRYRDALEYKPRDAVATLKLARALEKTKSYAEARTRYQQYLEILKDGPGAAEARLALERLKQYAGTAAQP